MTKVIRKTQKILQIQYIVQNRKNEKNDNFIFVFARALLQKESVEKTKRKKKILAYLLVGEKFLLLFVDSLFRSNDWEDSAEGAAPPLFLVVVPTSENSENSEKS